MNVFVLPSPWPGVPYFRLRVFFGSCVGTAFGAICVDMGLDNMCHCQRLRPKGTELAQEQSVWLVDGSPTSNVARSDGVGWASEATPDAPKGGGDRIRGQADLIYRDGHFYLAVVADVPEPPPLPPDDWLGVGSDDSACRSIHTVDTSARYCADRPKRPARPRVSLYISRLRRRFFKKRLADLVPFFCKR